MRILYLLGLGLSLLVGCAEHRNEISVESLLIVFEQEAEKYGVVVDVRDFPVIFTNLPGETRGRCAYTVGGKEIHLDTWFWGVAGAGLRELLLFHELGHCVLNQEHRRGSIMADSLIKGYFSRRDYYLEELFTYESSQ